MLTITNKNGKVLKEVFVIRRIEVMRGEYAGRIVHFVRSVKREKGQLVEYNYQVITFGDQDGRVSCNCEARGNCCHMLEASCYDMRRYTSITRKVVQPVVETSVKEPSLLEQVNEELAKVKAAPATQEEVAATAAKCLIQNADQVSYFLQLNRRAKALKPVPTPEPRKVSNDWLLGRRNGGTFSGKVA